MTIVIHRFPIVGVHSFVDIYAIFRFKLRYEPGLGISEMLKECLVGYLSNASRSTTAIRYWSGQPKLIQSLKETVLHTMYEFLKCTEGHSPTRGRRVDFRKNKVGRRVSWFSTKTRVLWMLEEADHKHTGLLSSFFWRNRGRLLWKHGKRSSSWSSYIICGPRERNV